MLIPERIRPFIDNGLVDGYPCLLGTTGPDGPNISPKSSMLVFDDDHLAYWERSKRQALENLQHDKRVIVFYNNMQAQIEKRLDSGFLRFYGVAELHENGPVWDAVFARLTEREQTHVGADTGIAVLIKVDRAADVRGNPLT